MKIIKVFLLFVTIFLSVTLQASQIKFMTHNVEDY